MRAIDFFICAVLLSPLACHASEDCSSDKLNREQELSCAHNEELQKAVLAERLYGSIRHGLSGPQQSLLEKNHLAWVNKRETDCALQRDAFNDWGKDSVPDADFQYQGCKNSVLDQQVLFYEGLICPDSLETGDKPDCENLQKVLRR
ncbi:hypothetical protein FAZ69_19600 [Trinickia terrae]|uniref:DUF1311 domain-containing protein n=1 Tax=Trinickia terrae TaxID=2571161 RepID=A0A4U1I143_9BURK|nr:hypothetical protein [Trinickia terrae]TKC86846.1 hypothetical protein FAZ69_19600 [Trinickia terrae]